MGKSQQPRTKHIPLRKCIATGESRPKAELIRVVRTPEGVFRVDDAKGRTNGRGAYLLPTVESFDLALKKRILQRTFKQNIPSDQLDQLKQDFIKRLLTMDNSQNV